MLQYDGFGWNEVSSYDNRAYGGGGGGSQGMTPEELQLQYAQLELQKLLGLGGQGIDQGQLDLARELGLGNLGISQQNTDIERYFAAIDAVLKQRGLAQEQEYNMGRLGLDTELGRGSLDLERLLGTGRLGLDTELGRAGVEQNQQQIDLSRILGLGGLDLSNRQFGLETELGRGGLALEQGGLAERIRAAMADEALRKQALGLEGTTSRASTLLQAQSQADARRMNSVNATRDLLGFMVPEGMQYAPGFEPGGTLASAAQSYGLPFNTMQMPTTKVNTAALANTPSIDPQLAALIASMGAT